MQLRDALKGQYRAGLEMLAQSVERCPDDVWAAGPHPRTFWRIAYHTVYYTHLYLMPKISAFQPWDRHCEHATVLWDDDESGMPPVQTTYSQGEMLDYIRLVTQNLDEWVDALDLESSQSGFPWYPIPKLDHQLLNLRHLGVHAGQLQERLYEQGIDLDWISKPPAPAK